MQTRRTLIWLCEGMCPCGGRRPSQRGVAGPHRQNDESASKPVTIVRGVCCQIWTLHSEFVISRRDGRQTREMSNGVVPFMRFHIIPLSHDQETRSPRCNCIRVVVSDGERTA